MTTTLHTIGYIVAFILMADAFGLAGWVLSNQHPADGFYLGTITAHLIAMIV